MEISGYIVRLEAGVWLADGDGDPSRTLKKEFAKKFDTDVQALAALVKARKYRPFERAKLVFF